MNIENPSDIPKLLQQAFQNHQAGKLQKAEQLYRRILFMDPDNADANHLLGLIACQFGKNNIGIQLIRKATQVKPEFIGAHLSLGNMLMSQGDPVGAMSSYRKVLALKPDYAEAHNNLGNVLSEQGDLDGAAASYRKAVSLKPDYAEAHNNLGNLLNSKGDLDEAIASYRKAIAINPDYAEAYNNLGIAQSNHGDLDGAAINFQKALSLKPDYAEVHNNLGNLYRGEGNWHAAIASYRKALAISPEFVEVYNNLGVTLSKQGDLDGAAASYQKALAIKPDYAEVHYNMGNIYVELGDFSAAKKSHEKALASKPDYAEVHAQLAALKTYVQDPAAEKKKDYESAIGKMVSLLAEDTKSIDEKIALNFSLGKVFEDLAQYGKAFAYFQEGNRIKRKTLSYDISADENFFQRVRYVFSKQFFIDHKGAGFNNSMPVFILGMPRSGSTLIEQILASHPEVHGGGEIIYLKDNVASYCEGRTPGQFPESVKDLGRDDFTRLGHEYVENLRQYSEAAVYITNKMPRNFIYIGLIKLILPGAKIIHSLRDPRDTCWSIFKNSFAGIHNYAYEQSELGRYYKLYEDLMAHWRSVLPGFIFEMRYEELVQDQENQTRKLLEYCELDWHDSCLEFHKTKRPVRTLSSMQVRQPLYKTSVQLWKEYEKELEPLLKALHYRE